MRSNPKNPKRVLRLLFLLYGAAILWLLFGRPPHDAAGTYWNCVQNNISLTPLHTIRQFWDLLSLQHRPYLVRLALVNLLGNVAVFVPLGFFLPCLWPRQRKLRWLLPTAVLLIVAVEVCQLFTLRGICDIDDLFLNLPGILLGFAFFHLLEFFRKKEH